jgi:gas vesicle protein
MFGRKPSPFNFYSFLALTIGAAAGAGLALLFAPKTGRQLQKQLKSVIDEQVESVQNVIKHAMA